MFTAAAVPAGLFFVLLFLVPETPRWLAKTGASEAGPERLDASRRRRPTPDRNWPPSAKPCRSARRGSFRDLLQPRMLRIVVIGSLLGIFSQISGANAVFIYAPDIFAASAGAGAMEVVAAVQIAPLIGLVTFIVFTFIPIIFVERVGRRAAPDGRGGRAWPALLVMLWYLLSFARAATGVLLLAAVLASISRPMPVRSPA